jgi:hypothetical protein
MLLIHKTWYVHHDAEFQPAYNFHFPWTSNINMEAMVIYLLCDLVVKVSGYRSRGPELDSRPYQFFWEVGSLERGSLSLVSTIEELLDEIVAAPV